MAKIELAGYYADKGEKFKRVPQEPARTTVVFWKEKGGVDEFRQVGWISMNTGKVWGLTEESQKDTPDLTPLYINVRGD